MPYNNTPITPAKEVTGTVSLPLARVKKIIATDEDISNCSNNAAFVITVAAEMFLQHLVDQSYNIVKSERKPRRNIQYRDIASAVARVENLEFLTDVVPKTQTYRQFKQKPASGPVVQQEPAPLSNGQKTLDTHMGVPPRAPVAGEQQATNGARNEHEPDAMDIDDRRILIDERSPAIILGTSNPSHDSGSTAGPNEQLMREQSQGDR